MRVPVAFALTSALVVGCAGVNNVRIPIEPTRSVAAPPADDAPTLPAMVPAPPRKPRPPEPDVDPASLQGLERGDVEAVLGAPNYQEDQPPAKVWHYVEEACVFRVYFYFDLQEQAFRAMSFKTTGKDGTENGAPSCLAAILGSRRDVRIEPAAGEPDPAGR